MEFLAVVLRIISMINQKNILRKSQNSTYSLFADHSVGKRSAVSRKARTEIRSCVFLYKNVCFSKVAALKFLHFCHNFYIFAI